MNQSIRATKPAKYFSLQTRTDCVIFDPKDQQIILSDSNCLSYYNQETLEFQQQLSLAKYDLLLDLKFQPCTHNLLLV